MEFQMVKVAHVRHCMSYKKTVFKCIFSLLPFPEEVDKYLFTFVGVFPLYFDALTYTACVPGPLPSSRSLPLQRYDQVPLLYRDDDLEASE